MRLSIALALSFACNACASDPHTAKSESVASPREHILAGSRSDPEDRSGDDPDEPKNFVLTRRLRDVLGPEWTCNETTCRSESHGPPPKDAIFEPYDDDAKSDRPASAAGDGLGITSQALTSSETGVLGWSGFVISEPFAIAYSTGGYRSMNVFANQSGNTQVISHACTRDYSSWCKRRHPVTQAKSADSTAMYDYQGGWEVLHYITLDTVGTGFSWYYRHDDACPAACTNQTWTECSVTPPALTAVDYPQALYERPHDERWIVYTATPASNIVQPGLTLLNSCTSATHFLPNCSLWQLVNLQFARGAVDSSGNIHLIMLNNADGKLFHTTFNTTNQTWLCNYDEITPFVQAGGTSTDCPGTPTYTGIGAGNNLRANFSAHIAIDDVSTPNNLVVAVASSSGTLEAPTAIYRSTNLGTTWSQATITNSNAYHPEVTFFRSGTSAVANLFHVSAAWDLDAAAPGSMARNVSLRSTNGGSTFFIYQNVSADRTVSQVNTFRCYWGDYDAQAPDAWNSSVFYGWTHKTYYGAIQINGRAMDQ